MTAYFCTDWFIFMHLDWTPVSNNLNKKHAKGKSKGPNGYALAALKKKEEVPLSIPFCSFKLLLTGV